MKKFMILAAGTMILSSAAFAQIGIAPELGINIANMRGDYTLMSTSGEQNMKFKGGAKLGVRAGANVNINLGDRLQIQPGLFYSIKGFKSGEEQNRRNGYYLAPTTENMTIHYAEIPVNVQYLFNDPGEGRFFVGLGGYVGVAFSGKDKVNGSAPIFQNSTATEETRDLSFGNDAPSNDLRRFDFGGQANAGYQLRSGIFFRAMYQLGISNLLPQGNRTTGESTLRSSNITASIGYVFGYHK